MGQEIRPFRLLLAYALCLPVWLSAAPEADVEAETPPFELVSVARFGERAVAVIGLEGGNRKVVALGDKLGRTGYVLSEVDAQYVELDRDGQIVTLTIDSADPESIARRKAAREARDQQAEAKPQASSKSEKPEKAISAELQLLKLKLKQEIPGEWKLENATIDDLAAALKKWTAGDDGTPIGVRVLKHPNATEALITASGTGTRVSDALNMFSKEFMVPYAATHDGKVLLGSGYVFRRQQLNEGDSYEAVAEQNEVDLGILRRINPKKPKSGSFIIVPTPVNP